MLAENRTKFKAIFLNLKNKVLPERYKSAQAILLIVMAVMMMAMMVTVMVTVVTMMMAMVMTPAMTYQDGLMLGKSRHTHNWAYH